MPEEIWGPGIDLRTPWKNFSLRPCLALQLTRFSGTNIGIFALFGKFSARKIDFSLIFVQFIFLTEKLLTKYLLFSKKNPSFCFFAITVIKIRKFSILLLSVCTCTHLRMRELSFNGRQIRRQHSEPAPFTRERGQQKCYLSFFFFCDKSL